MAGVAEASLLSVQVALLATLLCLPLALGAVSFFYKSRWRSLEVFFLLPLVLSPTVSGFLILWGFSPHHALGRCLFDLLGQVVFTPKGTTLSCIVVSFPLAFQALMIGRSRVPLGLEECGQVLGASGAFRLVTIIWPQMRSAVAVAALLSVVRSLGEFGASFMVGGNIPGQTQTLPLFIYSAAEQQQLGLAAIGALLSLLLGGLAYAGLRSLEHKGGGVFTGIRS